MVFLHCPFRIVFRPVTCKLPAKLRQLSAQFFCQFRELPVYFLLFSG
jgi:hypothetical protein